MYAWCVIINIYIYIYVCMIVAPSIEDRFATSKLPFCSQVFTRPSLSATRSQRWQTSQFPLPIWMRHVPDRRLTDRLFVTTWRRVKTLDFLEMEAMMEVFLHIFIWVNQLDGYASYCGWLLEITTKFGCLKPYMNHGMRHVLVSTDSIHCTKYHPLI